MISTLHQTKLTSRANPTCDSSRLAWHVTQSDRYSVLCWVDTNLPMILCQSMDAICSLFSANFRKFGKKRLSVWARGFAKSCMSNPSECMFYQWLAESIHQVWMVSDTGYLARTHWRYQDTSSTVPSYALRLSIRYIPMQTFLLIFLKYNFSIMSPHCAVDVWQRLLFIKDLNLISNQDFLVSKCFKSKCRGVSCKHVPECSHPLPKVGINLTV